MNNNVKTMIKKLKVLNKIWEYCNTLVERVGGCNRLPHSLTVIDEAGEDHVIDISWDKFGACTFHVEMSDQKVDVIVWNCAIKVCVQDGEDNLDCVIWVWMNKEPSTYDNSVLEYEPKTFDYGDDAFRLIKAGLKSLLADMKPQIKKTLTADAIEVLKTIKKLETVWSKANANDLDRSWCVRGNRLLGILKEADELAEAVSLPKPNVSSVTFCNERCRSMSDGAIWTENIKAVKDVQERFHKFFELIGTEYEAVDLDSKDEPVDTHIYFVGPSGQEYAVDCECGLVFNARGCMSDFKTLHYYDYLHGTHWVPFSSSPFKPYNGEWKSKRVIIVSDVSDIINEEDIARYKEVAKK